MSARKGGCLCGAICYELTAEPVASGVCYCRDCQYVSGGAPAYAMTLPRDGVRLTQGSPRVYWKQADSGQRVGRHFCGDCGTPLFAENAGFPAFFTVKVGTLDDPSHFAPVSGNIWVSSAQPWHLIDPSVPRFDTNPF